MFSIVFERTRAENLSADFTDSRRFFVLSAKSASSADEQTIIYAAFISSSARSVSHELMSS